MKRRNNSWAGSIVDWYPVVVYHLNRSYPGIFSFEKAQHIRICWRRQSNCEGKQQGFSYGRLITALFSSSPGEFLSEFTGLANGRCLLNRLLGIVTPKRIA